MDISIIHSAVNGPQGSGKAYFFRGDHFVVLEWNTPTTDKFGNVFKGRAVAGPIPITNEWWPTLLMMPAGFSHVFDAALSGHGSGLDIYHDKMYFFKEASYIRFDWTQPPVRQVEVDAALSAWQLGLTFERDVRGAFNGNASRKGKAYFFKGPDYVRYNWQTDGADPDYPKAIATLVGMPFDFAADIQAALDGDGEFADFGYLFKDGNYVRFNWPEVRVDLGPRTIVDNWPGVAELLLAGEAKAQALQWVAAAIAQVTAYTVMLTTGIPTPFDDALIGEALRTHFHISPSLATSTQIAHLQTVLARFIAIKNTLDNLHTLIRFRDYAELRTHGAEFEPDGEAKHRAYTFPQHSINVTPLFTKGCGPLYRAAVLIHELVHYVDVGADCLHDSPEWYLSGRPRLQCNVNGVNLDIEYYDQLTVDAALHNPSSYNAFAQHVFYGTDTRFGEGRVMD